MDISKQVVYWVDGAVSDLETAELLIKNKRFLHELAGLSFHENELQLLEILMVYQLEGRYPEYYPNLPSQFFAIDILN